MEAFHGAQRPFGDWINEIKTAAQEAKDAEAAVSTGLYDNTGRSTKPGNNKFHQPKAKARAKRKASKKSQRRNRR